VITEGVSQSRRLHVSRSRWFLV